MVACIQIAMDHSEAFKVPYVDLIVRVKLDLAEDSVMDLTPVLDPFCYYRILLLKFSTYSVKLCEKPAPCPDQLLVFHPCKLVEIYCLAVGPLENTDNQVSRNDHQILISLIFGGNKSAKVVNFMPTAKPHKHQLVLDSLKVLILGIRGDSDCKFDAFFILGFESVVLRCLYYLPQFDAPVLYDYLSNLFVVDRDRRFKQWHIC